MAGVLFDSELVKKVRGRTPINYGVRLHSADLRRNNLMSAKLFERSKSSEKFSKMKRQLDREYNEKNRNHQVGEILSEFQDDVKGQIIEKQRS